MQATPLPTDYTGSYIGGMSDDGSIVVGLTGTDTVWVAYRWNTASPTMTTGSVTGQVNPDANVISGDGTRVYGHTDHVSFEWRTNQAPAQMLNVPVDAKFTSCSATGLTVVGGYPGVNTEPGKGFIYDATSGKVIIPASPPYTGLSAFNGISADGLTVVGAASRDAVGGSPGGYYPVSWTSAGFNELPGGEGIAYAISANGQYAVGKVGKQGVLWSGTGLKTVTQLGLMATLPGWFTEARDVSNDGTVVVARAMPPTGGTNVALIWTPTGGLQKLSDALGAAGIDVSAWEQLQEVAAVSPNGKIIAGTGLRGGVQLGFIARLP